MSSTQSIRRWLPDPAGHIRDLRAAQSLKESSCNERSSLGLQPSVDFNQTESSSALNTSQKAEPMITVNHSQSAGLTFIKELLFNRYRALVLQDAKTSGGIGDGCTKMGTYHRTVYFKWLRW